MSLSRLRVLGGPGQGLLTLGSQSPDGPWGEALPHHPQVISWEFSPSWDHPEQTCDAAALTLRIQHPAPSPPSRCACSTALAHAARHCASAHTSALLPSEWLSSHTSPAVLARLAVLGSVVFS